MGEKNFFSTFFFGGGGGGGGCLFLRGRKRMFAKILGLDEMSEKYLKQL